MSDEKKSTKTLSADEIVTEKQVGRRSALQFLGTAVLGAAVAGAVTAAPSTAQAASDSDPQDAPGRGRTGMTDRDAGPRADGAGRGVCPERGHTDSDSGPGSDPAGRGRGPCHN